MNVLPATRLLCTWLAATALLVLSACASSSNPLNWHTFAFHGWNDRWASAIDLLAFEYGNPERSLSREVKSGQTRLAATESIHGPLPRPTFLYVKWRDRATAEVFEQRVDLSDRIPPSIANHTITFVPKGRVLYVYLVSDTPRDHRMDPTELTWLARYHVTYELYPINSRKH